MSPLTKALRAAECFALFVALPLFITFSPFRVYTFPTLFIIGLLCIAVLWFDRGFERRQLWFARGLTRVEVRRMMLYFVPASVGIVALTLLIVPERLFGFPRSEPVIYALVMLLYPILSAWPQEVIYRPFFFRRYRMFFPGRWPMILASAAAFGFVHIILLNPIAPLMTLVGGVLFGITYDRTRSTFAAAFEHTLYGWVIFTIGLGWFFYLGAVR